MKDLYGREIDYLRISVTDRCNLKCSYCVPSKRCDMGTDLLSFDQIVKIAEASAKLGIRKLRITGGEPLVRAGICDLCRELKNIEGIEELTLTTNGQLLEQYVQQLTEAGINRFNISLDTLRPEKYRHITRSGELAPVLNGIRAAVQAGVPVKLNVVLIGGFNEDEIGDFVALTRFYPIEVRFIELMPLGAAAQFPRHAFLSCEEVLRRVPQLQNMERTSGVARLYRLPDGVGSVGLISPVSCDFCSRCNRLRLTAQGILKPCLHGDKEISLQGIENKALEEKIRAAIEAKPIRRPDFAPGKASAGGRPMYRIGG